MISAFKTLRGRLAISAVIALALGVFAFGATTAMATPVSGKVSLSTSASCSSKNGVATAKITAKATAKGGATINNVTIDVEPGGSTYDASGNPTATATIPGASGNYTAVITADGSSNDPVQYALISVNGSRCSAKVSSQPFNPV